MGFMNSLRAKWGNGFIWLERNLNQRFPSLMFEKDAGTRLDAGTLTGFLSSIADNEKRSRCLDE